VTFKHTVVGEVLPKLRAEELPLYRLLDRIADPTLDERYRDTLCVAILPYMHSRMPTTMIVKPLHLMSDAELQQMREAELEHRRQVALGRGRLRVANEEPSDVDPEGPGGTAG
jgi:hypothetical protein